MPATSLPLLSDGFYAFDDFELDVPAFELRRSGAPVAMEPQVFEVLAYLVENAGKILTKDEILDRVWPERYVTEASLNVRVMAARKALGDSGAEQRYIKTIHGRGYRFIGDIRAQAAAAAALHLPSIELPHAGTSFIGRREELARIRALLAEPACRLVTITGPGGIGKTRLAFELLAAELEAGTHAVFIPLERTEPRRVAAAVATALGIQFGADDAHAKVVAYLASNPLTLVLDNTEHALAESRSLVEAILREAGEACLIVTSRAVLGLAEEWVFRIGGLSLESAEGTPGDAEALFLDRARRVGASLETGEDFAAIREICAHVEGLPLALELAASLARYMSPAQVRQLLAQDTACLTTGAQGVADRHRSLGTLFDESLRYLAPAERESLRALAVFEGPFDAAAAMGIAGAGLSELADLVDSSLVLAQEGRFSLHPLMRQHLRLAARGDAAHAEAHARYFAALATRHRAALQGRGQLEALRAMHAHAPNMFAAWRWAAANQQSEVIEQLRQALFTFLIFRGRFVEARDLAEAALPALDAAEHPHTVAALNVHYAWVLMRVGEPGLAIGAARRAMAATRAAEIDWLPGFGSDPRLVLAAFRVGSGDYAGGQQLAARGLALAEAAADEPGIAFASWLAAVCLYRQGELEAHTGSAGHLQFQPVPGESRFDEAASYLERATTILEAQGETWLRAFVETERGLNAGAHGHRETGIAHHRNAYRLRRVLDDPQGMTTALMYLADALIDMGLLHEAAACHEEMRALLLRCADATGKAELLRSSGTAAHAAGDLPRARAVLREAVEVSRALSFTNNVAGSLRALGEVFLDEGNAEVAGRIMLGVAADPSSTPGSRALARLRCQQLGLGIHQIDPAATLDALSDEAVRLSASLDDWLTPPATPAPTRPSVLATTA